MPSEAFAQLAGKSPPRTARALLLDPVFGGFFVGKIVATCGVWVHNLVAAVVVFQISGSALVVGIVTAVQFGPQLVLSPWAGALADRGNPARQIIIGRLVQASGSAALALVIWLQGGVSSMSSAAPVVICSAIAGVGTVLGSPALQSLVPLMVRDDEIGLAVTLNTFPMTAARAAGPALGAVALTSLGAAWALAGAAAAGLGFAAFVAAARLGRLTPTKQRGTDYSVRAAVRAVRADGPMVAALIGVAAVGVAADPPLTLGPVTATARGMGPEGAGWIVSAFGIGAALAFALVGRAQRRWGEPLVASAGLALMGVVTALSAIDNPLVVTMALFTLAGIGMSAAIASLTSIVQQRCPAELRGRVMALWLMSFLGLRPLAAALNGFLADVVSLEAAYLVSGGLVLAVLVLCRPRRLGAKDRPGRRRIPALGISINRKRTKGIA
ncbi:hypothetical protein RhoFasSB10_03843 [Rhodococcus fascians]|uniref:MFS transporter n=1 Tax=Rhodococcoides fascians TaxID=1828 RepID=UPI001427A38A|nr:hypothetical protein [Rhodococcus fascians]